MTKCFNAREGIFAFRTVDILALLLARRRVSMPARAFLLFGQITRAVTEWVKKGFNAREGIFAFRTLRQMKVPGWVDSMVSMPARAFLLFGQGGWNDVKS